MWHTTTLIGKCLHTKIPLRYDKAHTAWASQSKHVRCETDTHHWGPTSTAALGEAQCHTYNHGTLYYGAGCLMA
jgi:hypothetical protein